MIAVILFAVLATVALLAAAADESADRKPEPTPPEPEPTAFTRADVWGR